MIMYKTEEERKDAIRKSKSKYMKKRYYELKEQGKCVTCGKQDYITKRGATYCFNCAEKHRLSMLRKRRLKDERVD